MGDSRLPEEIHLRDQNPATGHRADPDATDAATSAAETDEDDFELIRGSGNIFRDFGDPDADREQLRCVLAARIMEVMDNEHLTVRAAHERTGFAAADFSRIRRAKLQRFTIDRLMTMLARLGQDVEVQVTVTPRVAAQV